MTKNNKLNNEFEVFDKNIKNLPNSGVKRQKDNQISKLQEELTTEKDQRKEERFIWVCVVVILFNVLIVSLLGFWKLVLTLLLEVPFLIFLANFLGVQYALKPLKELYAIILNLFEKRGIIND